MIRVSLERMPVDPDMTSMSTLTVVQELIFVEKNQL